MWADRTHLEGWRYLIDHVPSSWTSASFATISMSFASSSPMRADRTARMMGAIPLKRRMPVSVSRIEAGPRGRKFRTAPGDDDDGDVVRLAVRVELLEARVEDDVCGGLAAGAPRVSPSGAHDADAGMTHSS